MILAFSGSSKVFNTVVQLIRTPKRPQVIGTTEKQSAPSFMISGSEVKIPTNNSPLKKRIRATSKPHRKENYDQIKHLVAFEVFLDKVNKNTNKSKT